jgi:dihydroorotate dehydrogenase
VALAHGIDGLIATNTTTARPPGLTDRHRNEAGGLSGRPLLAPSTAALADLAGAVAGRMPLIGVGGIAAAADAWAKIEAGASLVQLYTGLVYHGPWLVTRINRGLVERLRVMPGMPSLAAVIAARDRRLRTARADAGPAGDGAADGGAAAGGAAAATAGTAP